MLATLPRNAIAWLRRRSPDPKILEAATAAVALLKPAVVVTGGSAGIGLAIAKRFLKAGDHVVLVARDPKALDRAHDALPDDAKQRCTTIACDVAAPDAPTTIAATLRAHGLYLDVLVNNAASGLSGPFLDQSAAAIENLIALNVTALTRLTRHALPDMIARGRGGILNVASLGGYIPGPNQAAYYASKAYVISLTEALASETRGSGVTVTCVAPGPVATKFHAAMGAARAPYRYLVPELSPERVAASAYRGFRLGLRVVVPGITARIMLLFLRLMPHPISVPLTGWLLKNPSRY